MARRGGLLLVFVDMACCLGLDGLKRNGWEKATSTVGALMLAIDPALRPPSLGSRVRDLLEGILRSVGIQVLFFTQSTRSLEPRSSARRRSPHARVSPDRLSPPGTRPHSRLH